MREWLLAQENRLLRDYALAFALAPQLERRNLRDVFESEFTAEWPRPPDWETLRRKPQQA